MDMLVPLCLFFSFVSSAPVLAQTYGCRYNMDLCSNLESCVEDNLFGTCQSDFTRGPVKFFHISDSMKQVFIFALQGLLRGGYGWSDVYTQCIIGGLLRSYDLKLTPHLSYCDIREEQRLRSRADARHQTDLSARDDSDVELVHEYLSRWRQEARVQPTSTAVDASMVAGNGVLGEEDTQLLYHLTSGNLSVDQLSTQQVKRLKIYLQARLSNDDKTAIGEPVKAAVGGSKLRQATNGDGIDSGEGEDKVIEDVINVFSKGEQKRVMPKSNRGIIGHEISDHLMQIEQRKVNSAAQNSDEQAPSQHDPGKHNVEAERNEAAHALDANLIDTTYVWMTLDKGVDTTMVHSLIRFIANQLHVDMSKVTNIRQRGEQLSFQVTGNYNTTHIASAIEDDLSAPLLSQYNVTVKATGIGHGPVTLQIAPTRQVAVISDLTTIVTISTVLVIIVVAVLILITWRCVYKGWARSIYSYDKLSNRLRGKSTQDSYEDLCRQRMQGSGDEKQEQSPADDVTPLPIKSDLPGQTERLKSPRSSTSSWNEEPVSLTMDISTGHIVLAYMEDHLRNSERLEKEWLALSNYSPDDNGSQIASLNMAANRYADKLPYDHNRVKLCDGQDNGDYINASFMADTDPRSPLYVATQGPMQHTVTQFWQMAWEHDCTSIVLLTSLAEGNKTLCYQFWPSDGATTYGGYELRLVSEHIWCDAYLVRSLYLKNTSLNQTRTVTLFHFLSWPQQGVPQHSKDLLDFRRKVNKSYRGKTSPIIVCCSDGSGRTGAYILLDMVINRIHKGVKEVDIAATLEHLRDQRVGCVQTKQQLEFVLSAVAEEVQALLKALPQ